MKRQLALAAFALASLRRRPGRNLTLLIGLALVTAAFSAVLFVSEALSAEYRAAARALPDLTIQRLVAGRPALIKAGRLAFVGKIPGVTSVRPRVWGYLFLPTLSGNLTVVGVTPGSAEAGRSLPLAAGDARRLAQLSAGQAVLGRQLARFLGLDVGDEFSFPIDGKDHWLTVSGLFDAQTALWTADVMLVSDSDARALLQVPAGQATDIAVTLSTPDEAVVLAKKIAAREPELRILDRQLMGRSSELTFGTRGGMLSAMLLPALLAFILLAWTRLSDLGPAERREIGVLKAVGWSTADVIAVRLWESGMLATVGAPAGIVAAYLYAFVLGAPGLSSLLFGWAAIYPPLELVPAVGPAQLAVLLGLTVVPFVTLSVVPAWRAAVRDPYEAVRGAV